MRVKILLFVIIQLSVSNINAQNLGDSLGGVKTNFQLFSDTTSLKAINQIIVQRAVKKSYGDFNFGVGWGYAYQSYHIEFITKEHLVEKEFKYKNGRDNNDKLELTFYSSNDNILATYTSDFSVVNTLYNPSSENGNMFYSIDLIDIPLVLLDQTVKINLIKKIADKKK